MAEWEWTCVCGQKLRTKAQAGEALVKNLCAACQEEADKLTEAEVRNATGGTAKKR